jgi:ferredoxin/flavodoxin---NADP+ reductase
VCVRRASRGRFAQASSSCCARRGTASASPHLLGLVAEEGWIRFIFMRVGKTTHELSHLEVGDSLADVVGPLGVPTHVEDLGRVAVIGGGVGAAVAYPVARAMAAAGNRGDVVLGARNGELLILREEFEALPLEQLLS